MTTRNFRVNNGLECGDIVISASANTITGGTTSAPSSDGDFANKKYVDDQDANIASDTLTLTNKTLTAAKIVDGGFIADANGNEALVFGTTGSAVNEFKITNKDTGNDPIIAVQGGDTNIGMAITAKGTGDIALNAGADVNIPANKGLTFGDDGEKIEGDGTNLTIESSGALNINNTGIATFSGNVRVSGDLTVDGTETIVNTTTLSIEDALIELNRNISAASGMPAVSGLQINRGEGSTATEMPLFWAWDEGFSDDGTTIHANAGGAFTAFRRQEGDTSTPGAGTSSLVDIRANVVHALATSSQYADVAERFEADAPMAEGAVVEVGGDAEITETTSEMSENVFGVISTQPAVAMNSGAGNSDSHPFVAMTGRTPVRVTGVITKGQRLVSSTVKGCARAVAVGESISPFNVIGRALESSTDAGIKLVNCAVRTNN